ncbi:MAG: aldo/keto reductase [Gammaproteobacteria bacterium]|nr:aldo/keto reductase [Gammaproteobacteria bacterium]
MDTTTPRVLGKSDLAVTPLGFGGGTIGAAQVSNEDSLATVAAAWETGVRFYDTAPWYGIGRSERRLGLALSGLRPREAFRVNTKVGKTLVPEPVRDEGAKTLSPGGEVRTPRDPVSGFRVRFEYTYDAIMGQHGDSLQRLGMSSVDSLTIHDIDYGYHAPEGIEAHLRELSRDGGGGAQALEELRASGRISAIGCGCNLESRNAWSWDEGKHEDLCERIAETVDLDFFVVAGGYTLLETRALRRILPLCAARGIGVVIAAPYASGWLADPSRAATYMYASAPPEIVDKSTRMQAICAEYDVPLAAVALQFPLAHPVVATVIPGAKQPTEPVANRGNLDLPVPPEIWERFKREGLLDEGAPTPA